MAKDSFDTNLIRLLIAQMWFAVSMNAAREIYGKSYFCLGFIEKTALDYVVAGNIGANYWAITPELLRGTPSNAFGFQPPQPDQE